MKICFVWIWIWSTKKTIMIFGVCLLVRYTFNMQSEGRPHKFSFNMSNWFPFFWIFASLWWGQKGQIVVVNLVFWNMINVGLVARSVTVTSLILVCFKMSFGLQDICFVICHSFSGFFWEVQCKIWWFHLVDYSRRGAAQKLHERGYQACNLSEINKNRGKVP